MSQDKPVSKLGEAAATLVSKVAPSAAATPLSLLRMGSDALANYIEQRNHRRYEEFCRSAYAGDVFPENAENLSADEFVSMLRACLADVEDEKSALYGRLASSIATGAVPHAYRHPLMVALSALTFAQMDRLRRAWVAGHHELIPHVGAGSKTQSEVFGGGGLMDEWDEENLTARSMIKDKSLTKLGERLVVACFSGEERTPSAIGERAWASRSHLPLVTYEMQSRSVVRLATLIASAARNRGIKCSPLASPPSQDVVNRLSFNMLPCLVILVDEDAPRALEKLSLFERMLGRGAALVVAFSTSLDSRLLASAPQAIAMVAKGNNEQAAEAVIAQVVRLVQEAGALPKTSDA